MTKKTLLLASVLFITISSFGSIASQKNYAYADPLYQRVMSICRHLRPTEEKASLLAGVGVVTRLPGAEVGEVTLLSTQVPDFPESTLAAGAYVAVSGPASFDIPPGEPGLITLHNRWTGAYVRSIAIPYPYPPYVNAPNALSVAAPGALGDIYVNQVLTGIYRVNSLFGFGEQYTAGPVPDIPPCYLSLDGDCSASTPCPEPPIPGAPPCTAELGRPPLGNSLLATADGTLYVSDSFQAVIWCVRPETRNYELWFTSPQLEGNVFSPFPAGANGLAKGPDGYLYVTNTTGGPMMGGAIYRLPMDTLPTEYDLELVVAWPPFEVPGQTFTLPEGPDGIKFDIDGNLWVTLAFGNAVAKLTMEDGEVVQEERFYNEPPAGGVPFQQPSEQHLDSRQTKAFVANHALEPPTPQNFALFAMETGVRGAPLEKPWLGWDCAVHDCDIDWRNFDWVHAFQLTYEELEGL